MNCYNCNYVLRKVAEDDISNEHGLFKLIIYLICDGCGSHHHAYIPKGDNYNERDRGDN